MSPSTSPGSSPRPATSSPAPTSSATRSTRSSSRAIRDIHVLGRRGPHQIAMTPKELGELGHLEDAAPRVDPADFPPAADDALLEPGMRKSVTHLREFANLDPAGKAKTIDFDFFAMPVAIEGDGKVERLIVERTRLTEDLRSVGTGETLRDRLRPGGQLHRLPDPADRGRALRAWPRPLRQCRGRDRRTASIASAGRGAGRPARSAPTAPTATRWPRRSPPISAGAAAAASRAGRPRHPAPRAAGSSRSTFRDWQRIEAAETGRARGGQPAGEVHHHRRDAGRAGAVNALGLR